MELFLQRIAQRFGLPDTSSVRRQLRRGGQRPEGPAAARGLPHSELAQPRDHVRLPRLERELLGVLLDRPKLLSTGYARELEGLLTSPALVSVLRAAESAVQENGVLDLTALLSSAGESEALSWLKERLSLQVYGDREDADEVLQRGIRTLAKERLEQQRLQLMREISRARRSGDEDQAMRLTKERDELGRSAHGLLRRER